MDSHKSTCSKLFLLLVMMQGFAAIATLTLRSPQNASKAVQAGAVDIAAEMMEKHPGSASMLRQACQMLRNLSVRNLENRCVKHLSLQLILHNVSRRSEVKTA